MQIHRFNPNRRKLILLAAILLSVVLLLVQCRSSTSDSPAAPIESIATEQKLCAVTLSLSGIESEESIRLFMSVCRGTGVVPCVFVSVDWLEEHSDAIELLEGAEFGLLFSESPKKWTQKGTMAAIAEANETFMLHIGDFPKYVRIADGSGTQSIASIMNSYGQVLVGSSSHLSDSPSSGAIVDCGQLDSTTGYTMAQYYGTTLAQGYSIQPLSQLLAN